MSESEEARPARASVLGSLRDRRDEVVAEQVLTLPVPRWSNPEILVRYGPVEHTFIRSKQDRLEKVGKDKRYEAEVDGNADILIKGCLAVVAVIDGQEYSLRPGDEEGEPTRFDADLAENLGLDENATARQTVRALFITQPDLISAAESLIRWSGYKRTEAEETLSGE